MPMLMRHASQSVFRVPKNSRAKNVLPSASHHRPQRVHAVKQCGTATLVILANRHRTDRRRQGPTHQKRGNAENECRNRQPHGGGHRKAKRKLPSHGNIKAMQHVDHQRTQGGRQSDRKFQQGVQGQRAPGAIRPFPQHGIAYAQSPHEHSQHGGRCSGGGTEHQPEFTEPRRLKD